MVSWNTFLNPFGVASFVCLEGEPSVFGCFLWTLPPPKKKLPPVVAYTDPGEDATKGSNSVQGAKVEKETSKEKVPL